MSGWPGLPALPYLGSFPETNVRLYSVGPDGRRGVVFCTLDAARLVPALLGRAAVRLPYQWSGMRIRRRGDVISYASRRRCMFTTSAAAGSVCPVNGAAEHWPWACVWVARMRACVPG
jgi:uncharacterized protein YqjF (DUF2071 family)